MNVGNLGARVDACNCTSVRENKVTSGKRIDDCDGGHREGHDGTRVSHVQMKEDARGSADDCNATNTNQADIRVKSGNALDCKN